MGVVDVDNQARLLEGLVVMGDDQSIQQLHRVRVYVNRYMLSRCNNKLNLNSLSSTAECAAARNCSLSMGMGTNLE